MQIQGWGLVGGPEHVLVGMLGSSTGPTRTLSSFSKKAREPNVPWL